MGLHASEEHKQAEQFYLLIELLLILDGRPLYQIPELSPR